jgi:hypothetical protein
MQFPIIARLLSSMLLFLAPTTSGSAPLRLTAYVPSQDLRLERGGELPFVFELENNLHAPVRLTTPAVPKLVRRNELQSLSPNVPQASQNEEIRCSAVIYVIVSNERPLVGHGFSGRADRKQILCPAGGSILVRGNLPHGMLETGEIRIQVSLWSDGHEVCRSQEIPLSVRPSE